MKKISYALSAVVLAATLAINGCGGAGQTGSEAESISGETETAEEADDDSTVNARISQLAADAANTLLNSYGVASVQYAVIDAGHIILSDAHGYADRQSQTPATAKTMYGIGSTSKALTALLVLNLVEEGKLDLDQSLTTYIPEFTMKDERYNRITPRMLLNYSSGIHGGTYRNVFTLGNANTEVAPSLLATLAEDTLKADPGAYSVYCNDGFTLLEILIERVSGQSYSDYFAETVSKPLKLNHTKTPQDDFDRALLAGAYPYGADEAYPVDVVNSIASGGFYSTAEDLCRISQIFMGRKQEILIREYGQDSFADEFRRGLWPEETESLFAVGLAWDSVHTPPFDSLGIQAVSKGGNTLIYHSSLVVFPEQNMAMAVTSSGGNAYFNNMFAATVMQEIMKDQGIIDDTIPVREFTPPIRQEMPEEYAQYSGLYGTAMSAPTVVEIVDGAFTMADKLGFSACSDYYYSGDGVFTSSDGSMTASFETLENGHTYLKIDAYLTLPGIGQSRIVYYAGQKLAGEPLSEELAPTWNAREGRYLVLDDIADSQVYYFPLINIDLVIDEEIGQTLGCRIADENHAVNEIQIPVFFGSDTTDLIFFTEHDQEYLRTLGYTLINEQAIPTLNAEGGTIAIGDDGFARWYHIPDNLTGKQITVSVPDRASFAVYDADNTCVYFSVVDEERTVTLPAGGKVAFIGVAGDTFDITY